MAPDPTNPADDSPLDVAERASSATGDAPFSIRPGAVLRCGTCGVESPATSQSADEAERTEGASDPADMTMVVPVTCPACGAQGSLTLGYGPDADPDASDFIAAVPRDARATGARPQGSERS